jgi:hypothetical protein
VNRVAGDEEAEVGRLGHHDRQAHAAAAKGLSEPAALWIGTCGWRVPGAVHDSARSFEHGPCARHMEHVDSVTSTRAAVGLGKTQPNARSGTRVAWCHQSEQDASGLSNDRPIAAARARPGQPLLEGGTGPELVVGQPAPHGSLSAAPIYAARDCGD